MQPNDTINLLISCESQAQLETYLAQFREAGQATRAHRVASLRNLGDQLRDPQWDLLIASDRHPELSPAEALSLLTERASDLPCLVRLADARGEPALALLRQGAREVIGADDNERLLRAALREVRAVREHRELATLRVQYEEIARRAELLLAASQDAIGYVVDGMHVHANELYASLFGYSGIDELPSVPLVDLIADDNQREFKEALRRYRTKPEEQTAIEFTGRRADGTDFAGQLVLSTASYEGEPCMQVLVRASAAAAVPAAAPVAAGGAAPGGLGALRDALGRAGAKGSLVLVGVDSFPLHCRNHGVGAAMRLVTELGEMLAQAGSWGTSPLRAGDAVLALVRADGDAHAALTLARAAVEHSAAHIHAIGTQSANCSIVAVVAPLERIADEGVDALIDRAWSALLTGAERAATQRAADAGRVQLLEPPAAAPAAPAPSSSGSANAVAEALKQAQFRVLFQPIVSLRGDSSEYYEVQVMHDGGKSAGSWLHEAQLAESSLELDKWVVIEAMKKLSAHRARHPATRLLLPVGAGAVLDAEFANWFALALRGAEVPAESVALQLAHPSVASYLRQAKQLAERVQGLGCQVSVSEVHSASNPLGDLVHLKPQFARVDASLALTLRDPESVNTVIKPLIEALHQEQIASIMPNVEGAGVLAALWQLGVNFIQGDYLQSPQTDMHYEFTDLT